MMRQIPKDNQMETKEKNTEFSGKAIYRPKGKAGEYARWAANLYVGCSNGCSYCYCKTEHNEPLLKKCFKSEQDAIWTFRMELMSNRNDIIREGGVFFSFSTDPCLMKTWRTHFDCIVFALAAGVPVTILTKCVGWLDEPYTKLLWSNDEFKKKLCVGFTLTGMDEMEPEAASNDERIEAMEMLHDKGIHTFASIEPVIDIKKSLEMITRTRSICDLHKIGLLTGEKREYSSFDVADFMTDILFLSRYTNPIRKVYFKDSVLEAVKMTREMLEEVANEYEVENVLADKYYTLI